MNKNCSFPCNIKQAKYSFGMKICRRYTAALTQTQLQVAITIAEVTNLEKQDLKQKQLLKYCVFNKV